MILAKKLTVNPAEHVQLPSARAGAVRPENDKSDAKGGNETAAKRSRRRGAVQNQGSNTCANSSARLTCRWFVPRY